MKQQTVNSYLTIHHHRSIYIMTYKLDQVEIAFSNNTIAVIGFH